MTKKERDTIQRRPIGSAMAYFKLTEPDQLNSANQDNDCSRKFIDYLTRFHKTSDIVQCQEISK